jgi:hypothetical protein
VQLFSLKESLEDVSLEQQTLSKLDTYEKVDLEP